MTPAVSLLNKKKIAFTTHQYHHDVNHTSYGEEAAEKLNVEAHVIFKTLVVKTDNQSLAVAIIPVLNHLNLKAIANKLNVKKVQMADVKSVQSATGYILGGVSPLGQKKQLTTIIDSSAEHLDEMYVSGGKRGLEIALSPSDLQQLTRATFAPIKSV